MFRLWRSRRLPGKGLVLVATGALLMSGLVVPLVSAANPSDFVNITNHQVRFSGTGSNDWANSGGTDPASPAYTCPAGTIHVTGTNGLFDCGKFNSATTPPTAPQYVGPTTDVPAGARAFIVDPLSVDHTTCALGSTAITGDPTTYTGAGSEKNGTLLSTDTWGFSSVPNKDEISNVYALGHRKDVNGVLDTYEIFFGAERVVNNGDSHLDFEFLQSKVSIVANVKRGVTDPCTGTFSGDRTQGDMLLSVDFTTGGTLGGTHLYVWDCLADPSSFGQGPGQPGVGTICNPSANGQSVPHYQEIGETSVSFGVNDGATAIDGGGWASRNADGTQSTNNQIATNELMEGGINLKDLGFTGCLSSFLPHTRSAQSFTATLKDFALVNFNTCTPTTSMAVSPSTSQLIHAGGTVNLDFAETNDGNVSLTSPRVDVSFSPTGPTGCASTTLSSGDTNNNGILDAGETFHYTCTATFPSAGSYTVTGTGHGTFNGQDITYPTDPQERAQVTVRVISPSTTLTKTASATSIHIGDTVTYTYTEANGSTGGNGTSDLDLTGVGITDDTCSPLSPTNQASPNQAFNVGDLNRDGILNAGETWTFTCQKTFNSAGSFTNTAVATGTDAIGSSVTYCSDPTSPPTGTICSQTERAQQTVTVINPNTSLTVLETAVVNVTYTYKESNTGNTVISNPSVTDNKCSTVTQTLKPSPNQTRNLGDANNDGIFDPGETWIFSCSVNALLTVDTDGATTLIPLTDTTSNTANADGTDPLGRHITYANGYTLERDGTTVTVTVSHP